MKRPVLFVVVPLAFGLNAWLGDRVRVGEICPILTPPSATAIALVDGADSCARQCLRKLEGY